VLEFVVDRNLAKRNREAITEKLIKSLEYRSRRRGDEIIKLNYNSGDETVSKVLKKFCYRETPGQLMHIAILDITKLLYAVLNHRKDRLEKNWRPSFLLKFKSAPYQMADMKSVSIRFEPEFLVEPNPIDLTADITIKTEMFTLSEIIFKRKGLDDALNDGSVTIDPLQRLNDVLNLFRLIVMDLPWYTPLADVW